MWPWNTIRLLRAALAASQRLSETWLARSDDASWRLNIAQREIIRLKAQLAEATRNDQRDTKSGRFKKGDHV